MTPARLVALVTSALGRKPNPLEIAAWGAVLEHTRDDDADQGLVAHRASSPHPPTPADVRRQAAVIANDRAMRAVNDRLREEAETGLAVDPDHPDRHGKPLVPMPDHVRQQMRELARRTAARTAEIQEVQA